MAANRGKLDALVSSNQVQLLLVTTKTWTNRDVRQRYETDTSSSGMFPITALSAVSFGSGSTVLYAPVALFRVLRRFRPQLVHLEEEPWSLAALEVSLVCLLLRVPFTFFTWENTQRRLPLVFRAIRRFVLGSARAAIAGKGEKS